jgi:hypothetical protein
MSGPLSDVPVLFDILGGSVPSDEPSHEVVVHCVEESMAAHPNVRMVEECSRGLTSVVKHALAHVRAV